MSGEYWVMPDKNYLSATDGGDYNHEGLVVQRVISVCCDALNIENQYDTDYVWFWNDFLDELGSDPERADLDPSEVLIESLVRDGLDLEYAKRMLEAVHSDQDARAFAINEWNWYRVAFNNVEAKTLTPESLRFIGEFMKDLYFEESGEDTIGDEEVTVSLLNGPRYDVTLDALDRGSLRDSKDADLDNLSKAATAQVRKMDVQQQHPYYRGNLGDSVVTIRNNLMECAR